MSSSVVPIESMQEEEQEGAVVFPNPTPVQQIPNQGISPGFSFLPGGQIPFFPPSVNLHFRSSLTDPWDHLDADSSSSDSSHQLVEHVTTQTSTTAFTVTGANEGRLYPHLSRSSSFGRLTGTKPKPSKRARSAESAEQSHRELPPHRSSSDDEGLSGPSNRIIAHRDATKAAFLTQNQTITTLVKQLKTVTKPGRFSDKKTRNAYKAIITEINNRLINAQRECEVLRNKLITTEQAAQDLLLNQKISFVNSTTETFNQNHIETQKLYDRLNVTESQRDALVNNLAAFRAALEQHFQDQWASFENTVVKEKARLLQKLSDKRSHTKYLSQELRKLELQISSLTTDLESCTTGRKQLQELVDTLNSNAAVARTQIENKDSEISYQKKIAEERAKIIADRGTTINQWTAHCNTLTAEAKLLNDRIGKGITECSVHEELITQYKKESEDLRSNYNEILARNGVLDKELESAKTSILHANQQYAKKVTEVDDLNRRVTAQIALNATLQQQVTDSLQRVTTADETVAKVNATIFDLQGDLADFSRTLECCNQEIEEKNKEILRLKTNRDRSPSQQKVHRPPGPIQGGQTVPLLSPPPPPSLHLPLPPAPRFNNLKFRSRPPFRTPREANNLQ